MISNLKLIYRATDDGFAAADFHRKCDTKENTLVLVISHLNFIFGGYTSKRWDS